jgi:hypothetical protein
MCRDAFTGHDEVIRHGENGLVVGFDDIDGAASMLDLLARDRRLLQRLSSGAIESMSEWPSADEAATTFATALTELADAPEPGTVASAAATWSRWRAAAEAARTERGEVAVRLHEQEALIRWQEETWKAEIESLTSSRTYKLAQRMQRASHLLRR